MSTHKLAAIVVATLTLGTTLLIGGPASAYDSAAPVASVRAPASATPDTSADTSSGDAGGTAQLVLRPAPAPTRAIKPIPGFRMNALRWFYIQNHRNGRFCLDAARETMGNASTKVQLWECTADAPNQIWAQVEDEARVWHLLNLEAGKCLDADMKTIGGNGTMVQLWQCTIGAHNQGWAFEMDSSAIWHLRVDMTPRRSLDADVNSLGRNGSLVHLWDHTPGATNQGWRT